VFGIAVHNDDEVGLHGNLELDNAGLDKEDGE
jgi:hypothetical protein